MAVIKKPGVSITQTYAQASSLTTGYLPTLIVGKRYNVFENQSLGEYESGNYVYPGKGLNNTVDTAYTTLTFKELYLRYYTNAHTWKRTGAYSNRIRTLLSNNLIFKGDNCSFDREVAFGDLVDITMGGVSYQSRVSDFAADQSPSSFGAAVALAGNQASQSHSVGAATAGPSQTAATATSGGTYIGSLLNNVLSDTITVTVAVGGNPPVITADSPITTNNVFDSTIADTYTIIVVQGGNLGTATYQVISNTGDNSGILLTPLSGVNRAIGTKGLQFQFPAPISLVAGTEYKIVCTPSDARLRITTASGKDQYTSRVFPGFGYSFGIVDYGATISFTGTSMPVGYYWTIAVQKQVAATVANSAGTYTGTSDVTYFVRVIQGGTWGHCVVQVTGGTEKVITVNGYGVGNSITVGDGVTLYFNTNVQGGLVKDDIFSVACVAAANTEYRTLVLQDSLPDSTVTVSSTAYGGTNPAYDTLAVTGTYSETNTGLELYASEVYTLIVTTPGDFHTAVITVTTLSGNDNGTLTPEVAGNAYGNYGITLTFSGTEGFNTGDVWTFSVSKTTLTVNLALPEVDTSIPRLRVEDQSQTAWESGSTEVIINGSIKLAHTSFVDPLTVHSANMYLTYRELHTTGANVIATELGTNHVDNPVKYGYDIARLYSTNVSAMYITDATKAFSYLESQSGHYRLCIMDFDNTIIDAAISHVNKMASKNKWRIVYCCEQIPDSISITTGKATILLNINDSNKYTLFRSSTGNFSAVQPGDSISYLGSTHTVKQVYSPTELVLNEDYGSVQTVSADFTISRTLDEQGIADYYVYIGNKYSSKRVVCICPDTYGDNLPGYYLGAHIGGYKSNVVAHTPITNLELDGISVDLSNFSEDQLDQIASSGIFIITQDSGLAYVRHQLTTDVSDLAHRELSMVENYDAFCYGLLTVVSPFIGRYNAHPGVLAQIDTDIEAYCYQQTATSNLQAGPSITGYERQKLELVEQDKLLVQIRIYMAGPLNYMDVIMVA